MANWCYCDLLGWVDRTTIVPRESKPKIGETITIAPLQTITRELWGQCGTITKEDEDKFFVSFASPVKSVGALMTGVWLKSNQLL